MIPPIVTPSPVLLRHKRRGAGHAAPQKLSESTPSPTGLTFEVFRRVTWRGKRWFWHLKAKNHEIVCAGQSSGYANKGDVLRIIDKIAAVDTAQIKFLD